MSCMRYGDADEDAKQAFAVPCRDSLKTLPATTCSVWQEPLAEWVEVVEDSGDLFVTVARQACMLESLESCRVFLCRHKSKHDEAMKNRKNC